MMGVDSARRQPIKAAIGVADQEAHSFGRTWNAMRARQSCCCYDEQRWQKVMWLENGELISHSSRNLNEQLQIVFAHSFPFPFGYVVLLVFSFVIINLPYQRELLGITRIRGRFIESFIILEMYGNWRNLTIKTKDLNFIDVVTKKADLV
jgi:hypothetical protein